MKEEGRLRHHCLEEADIQAIGKVPCPLENVNRQRQYTEMYLGVMLKQHLLSAPSCCHRALPGSPGPTAFSESSKAVPQWPSIGHHQSKLKPLKTFWQFLPDYGDMSMKNPYCLVNLGICLDFTLMTTPMPLLCESISTGNQRDLRYIAS